MNDWARHHGPQRVRYPLLQKAMEDIGAKNARQLHQMMEQVGIDYATLTGIIYDNVRPRVHGDYQQYLGVWRLGALQLSEFFQYSPEDLFELPAQTLDPSSGKETTLKHVWAWRAPHFPNGPAERVLIPAWKNIL